jgi:hypothetical protein
MRTFALFFALQFVSYMNLTLSIRAMAHAQYEVLEVTSTLAPLLAWIMIEHVSHDHAGWTGRVGVILGGVSATLLGVWLSQHFGGM